MNIEKLRLAVTGKFNSEVDYPCLSLQAAEFQKKKPLAGYNILHATPIFLNSVPKIIPLLVSGATVTVVPPPGLPYDPTTLNLLIESGIKVLSKVEDKAIFDIVLDCAGLHSKVNSRFGAVELTKSGEKHYNNQDKVCVSVDNSPIKLIEDILGTSDGLLRALSLKNLEIKDKAIVLFGFGKVGRGVYLRLKNCCQSLHIIEKNPLAVHPWNASSIFLEDKEKVRAILRNANMIITATGVEAAMSEFAQDLHGKFLINMGAEDEFGEVFSPSAIFNNKAPANFLLKEPTRLRYLDATFALHNQAACDLIKHPLALGLHSVSKDSEKLIMDQVKEKSVIWKEICEFKLHSYFC